MFVFVIQIRTDWNWIIYTNFILIHLYIYKNITYTDSNIDTDTWLRALPDTDTLQIIPSNTNTHLKIPIPILIWSVFTDITDTEICCVLVNQTNITPIPIQINLNLINTSLKILTDPIDAWGLIPIHLQLSDRAAVKKWST